MKRIAACLFVALATAVPATAADPSPSAEAIDYDRQVRPILSKHCYACHGPDAAQLEADLRLDQKQTALAELSSGKRAIVPGDPAASQLIARITTDDAAERMPPAEDGEPLSAGQVEILRRWIEQGANWQEHWAYQPVRRPATPEVNEREWPQTPIDRFILRRLEREGLRPSPRLRARRSSAG